MRNRYGVYNNVFNFYCQVLPTVSPSVCVTVQCPPGTYYDSTSELCVNCDVGTYQDQPMMTSCVACGMGLTTRSDGSSSASDCICTLPTVMIYI